jgi:hypothetical protein
LLFFLAQNFRVFLTFCFAGVERCIIDSRSEAVYARVSVDGATVAPERGAADRRVHGGRATNDCAAILRTRVAVELFEVAARIAVASDALKSGLDQRRGTGDGLSFGTSHCTPGLGGAQRSGACRLRVQGLLVYLFLGSGVFPVC